jgi:malonate transporter MadL subunit
MYIPVVIAMSATQNVKAALSGGWVALVVGVFATLLCFLLIPLLSKLQKKTDPSL